MTTNDVRNLSTDELHEWVNTAKAELASAAREMATQTALGFVFCGLFVSVLVFWPRLWGWSNSAMLATLVTAGAALYALERAKVIFYASYDTKHALACCQEELERRS